MWHLLLHLIRPLLSAAKDELAERNEENFVHVVNPKKFIGHIGKMGYFKYADITRIPELENSLTWSLVENRGLTSIADKNSGTPYDYRIYEFNAQNLLEKGGVISVVKPLKKTFDKLMIPLLWTNESVTFNKDETEYRISLNGKEYPLYKGSRDSAKRAGLIKSKVVDMLNDQLKISGSDERIYLTSTINEGRIVFLTKKMYSYISEVIKNRHIKPMDVKAWSMWNQLI